MPEERPKPNPGKWRVGAYYRNVARVRISSLWEARCSAFRVEPGTVWLCNRVFSRLERPCQVSPYWLDYIELLTFDPRPDAIPDGLINFNCIIGSWSNHTRGFVEIESPLELLALSEDGTLPVTLVDR